MWTNGSTRFRGGSNNWITFCSNKPLPKYFRCNINIHEEYDPNQAYRFIGISTYLCDGLGRYYDSSNNWYALNHSEGICWNIINPLGRGNVTFGKANDIVSIIYDKSKRLTFEVNNVNIGKYIEKIEGPFYIACADASNSLYEILEVVSLDE